MILTCKQCGTSLDLDPGFSGGVCRCKNCGALLSVPANADQGAPKVRPSGPPAAPAGSKSRTPRTESTDGQDFGLSSSIGISSSGLRAARPDPVAALTKTPPASGSLDAREGSKAGSPGTSPKTVGTSSGLSANRAAPASVAVMPPTTMPAAAVPGPLPTPVALRAEALKKNRVLFWCGIGLIGVITVILVIAMVSFMSHPDVR